MRRFAGTKLGDDRIPDETTILNLRHLLKRQGLPEAIFADALHAVLCGGGPDIRIILAHLRTLWTGIPAAICAMSATKRGVMTARTDRMARPD